jgi:hypothetical protein
VAFLCPKFSFYTFIDTGIFLMNSHTQIQNTLNNPPLQPYSPNLNPTTQNSPTQQVEVELEQTRPTEYAATKNQNTCSKTTCQHQTDELPTMAGSQKTGHWQ